MLGLSGEPAVSDGQLLGLTNLSGGRPTAVYRPMTEPFFGRRGSPCVAFAALWLLSGLLRAGVNEWTPAGPPGERVAGFAVDPTNSARLYAGTAFRTLAEDNAGVFRSADRGQTWQFTELGGLGITEIAVDARDPSVVYAASFTGALFRGAGFGATWTRSPLSQTENIRSITQDPSNPGSFYAAIKNIFFVFQGDSICRSDDGFRTWSQCAGFADGTRVGGIAVDSAVPSRVYASIDGLLQVSSDRGFHWAPVTNPPPGGSRHVAARASLPAIVYADGLFASGDAAATWAFLGTPPLGPGIILPDPSDTRTISVAGVGGVSRTSDGGASWIALTRGFPSEQAGVLVFDPSDSGTLYATASGSLLRMTVSNGGVPCSRDEETLCLGDARFEVKVSWRTPQAGAAGKALPLTQDAGAFWFFSANNLELVVKVVDGRSVNGRFWIFGAGLTDVAYDLAVTDRKTGAVWRRAAEAGRLESFADTAAF